MQYIVLDLEWNQALTKESVHRKDFSLAGEIIQIGAVKLDAERILIDQIRLSVAPKYYKKMHWSVKKLTGISTQSLADGLGFPEAYEKFSAWCGNDFVFLTWGPDDMPMLRSNLKLHRLHAENLAPAYDLQKLYSQSIGSDKRQWSLSSALEHLGITDTFPPHDALNDARNAAKIFQRLDLDSVTACDDDSITKESSSSESMKSNVRKYVSYTDMARDSQIGETSCPTCGKALSFGKWIRRAPGKRIALATCSCGAAYIMRLYWHADTTTGEITAARRMMPASEEQVLSYLRAVKKRRRSRKKAGNSSSSENTSE